MLRIVSIVVVSFTGMVAGCHALPESSRFDDRNAAVTSSRAPIPQIELPASNVKLISLTEDTDESLKKITHLEQPNDQTSAQPQEEPVTTYTLADLEEIAFQHNPALAAAAARMDMARGQQVQAGLYPNPVIGYHATEIGNLGSAGQQGAFILQKFITAGKLQLDEAIAGTEIDETHFRFHAQEQRVLSDVRLRFYDALVAQRRVKLTKELAGIGDDFVKSAETLLKSRLGTENDTLQARIKADESHIMLDNARNQHFEAWQRLMAVVGTPAEPITELTDQLELEVPEYRWDDCYALVLNNHPQLDAAKARVERACLAIQRAEIEPIPNIDLSVSVRHHNVSGSDVANVQVGFPIPIFNKNQGNISSAEAEWFAAKNNVRRMELDLQDRLAIAHRRYENARKQIERYSKRMIPQAKKSLELVKNGFDKGQIDYLNVLTSQQTYLQVNLSYLDSLREFRTAVVEIEGQLLSGSLTSEK